MCQSKDQGGIRCSSIARKALEAARKSGDPKRITIAKDKYFITTAGLKELKDSNDPRYEGYKNLREKYITIAKSASKDVKLVTDKKKVTNKKQNTNPKRDYIEAEKSIVTLFSAGATFNYQGKELTSIISAKPQVQSGSGEGKTDVYIKAIDSEEIEHEIKISYKKENADTYENWLKPQRAEVLFGKNWKDLLKEAVEKNREKLIAAKKYSYKLYNKDSTYESNVYTVGYAIDLRSVSRGLSVPLDNLTHTQEKEIYSGATLPEEKRDGKINDQIVKNSGVATHMLVANSFKTPQEAIDSLITMDEYIEKHRGQLHIAFKAINYSYEEDKYSKGRLLIASVNWSSIKHDNMVSTIDSQDPFSIKSDDVVKKIRELRNQQNKTDRIRTV